MNCDDVRGLEAEIVLGMLDSLTETEVMLHLDSCTDHPQLAGYRAALLALDLSLAPIQPSSELNERIAATVRTRRSSVRSPPAWLITIAAALLIGLIVSSIWVIRGEDTSLNRTFETASGVQVDVHAESGRAELRLSLANLDTSSTDTFTAWAIRDGKSLSSATSLRAQRGVGRAPSLSSCSLETPSVSPSAQHRRRTRPAAIRSSSNPSSPAPRFPLHVDASGTATIRRPRRLSVPNGDGELECRVRASRFDSNTMAR